jgi:hypothetical protein
MPLIVLGVIAGLLLAALWPGNPASRAVISVTDSTGSVLRSPGPIG